MATSTGRRMEQSPKATMATLTAASEANDAWAMANAGPLARTPVTSEVAARVDRAGPPSSQPQRHQHSRHRRRADGPKGLDHEADRAGQHQRDHHHQPQGRQRRRPTGQALGRCRPARADGHADRQRGQHQQQGSDHRPHRHLDPGRQQQRHPHGNGHRVGGLKDHDQGDGIGQVGAGELGSLDAQRSRGAIPTSSRPVA